MYYVVESQDSSGYLYSDLTNTSYEVGSVYTVRGYESRVVCCTAFESHKRAVSEQLLLAKLFSEHNLDKDRNFIPRSKRKYHGR